MTHVIRGDYGPIDPDAIRLWNLAQQFARRDYRRRTRQECSYGHDRDPDVHNCAMCHKLTDRARRAEKQEQK